MKYGRKLSEEQERKSGGREYRGLQGEDCLLDQSTNSFVKKVLAASPLPVHTFAITEPPAVNRSTQPEPRTVHTTAATFNSTCFISIHYNPLPGLQLSSMLRHRCHCCVLGTPDDRANQLPTETVRVYVLRPIFSGLSLQHISEYSMYVRILQGGHTGGLLHVCIPLCFTFFPTCHAKPMLMCV